MEELNNKLELCATQIIDRLKDIGFKVHRYNAKTSNSIYLKIDYGACGTIRISDHSTRVRRHKFNVELNRSGRTKFVRGNNHSLVYGSNAISKLINDITSNRYCMINKNDLNWYERRITHYKESSMTPEIRSRGFWRGAYES